MINDIIQVGCLANQITSTRNNPQRERVYLISGICPALNTMEGGGRQPLLVVKKDDKDTTGYAGGQIEMISGGVCDVTQPNSKTRRGRAQGNPPGTICPALMAHNSGGLVVMTEQQKEFADRLAIRKLIPEECFILQGMKKEDVEKCRAVGLSNSALFKIAGNGLIANVIQYIMEHIYKAVINHEYQTTDERMIASGYGV